MAIRGDHVSGTIDVTLDVAGFYFNEKVTVARDATVETVMEAVRLKTRMSSKRFQYETKMKENFETKEVDLFVNRISIEYADAKKPPKSRQTGIAKDLGTYAFSDSDLDSYRSSNSSDVYLIKNLLLAWQYYVYDKEGVDYARSRKGALNRKIVSFTRSSRDEGVPFEDGDTVVWRLVAILAGPTRPFGTKQSLAGAMA